MIVLHWKLNSCYTRSIRKSSDFSTAPKFLGLCKKGEKIVRSQRNARQQIEIKAAV